MLPGSERVTDAVTAADAAFERSSTMAKAGQGRAALANIRTAVRLYRQLADDEPEVYGPDLAVALGALSDRLGENGDTAAALDAAQESVALLRTLRSGPDEDADLFAPYLGAAVGVWAQRLHEAGRDDEALVAARETVDLFDGLPPEDRQRHHAVLDRTRVLRLHLSGA